MKLIGQISSPETSRQAAYFRLSVKLALALSEGQFDRQSDDSENESRAMCGTQCPFNFPSLVCLTFLFFCRKQISPLSGCCGLEFSTSVAVRNSLSLSSFKTNIKTYLLVEKHFSYDV